MFNCALKGKYFEFSKFRSSCFFFSITIPLFLAIINIKMFKTCTFYLKLANFSIYSLSINCYQKIWMISFLFFLNWCDCTVKTGSARKLGQSLNRLVQNLTLRNDCNLIPSAHGTQHLSSQSDHWTKGFHFTKSFPRRQMC